MIYWKCVDEFELNLKEWNFIYTKIILAKGFKGSTMSITVFES